MNDWFKNNMWSLVIAAATVISTFTLYGYRISAIEARQDRQSDAITEIRNQLTETQKNYAALEAKVDGVKESVDYIRNRIDMALKN